MGAYQFMPETVQMLHKQGMKFNPLTQKEARQAAKTYLGQLAGSATKAIINKALAQYGGFVTQRPNRVCKQGHPGATQPHSQSHNQYQVIHWRIICLVNPQPPAPYFRSWCWPWFLRWL